MKSLTEIWRLLTRRQRHGLILMCVVAVVVGLSTLIGIAAVLPFFTVLAEPSSIHGNATLASLYEYFNFDSDHSFTIALGLGFIAIVTLANAINMLGSQAMNRFALSVRNDFHALLFEEYLQRNYQFQSSVNSAVLSRNIVHEVGRVFGDIIQNALALITNGLTIAFIVGSAAFLNLPITIAAFAILGGSYVLIYVLVRRGLLRNGLVMSRSLADRIRIVNESFGAIREIAVAQAQRVFVERFTRSCALISQMTWETLAIAQSPRYILECLMVAGLVGIALALSNQHTGIAPRLPQLTFMAFAAYRLLPALQQVFSAAVRIRADRPALTNIADDSRCARARKGGAAAAVEIDRSWQGRPRDEIRLNQISFRYSRDGACALRDVTLRIRAGSLTGLTGPNGSGKTTLADVMSGLLTPDTGQLEVDGITIDDANRRSWQSTIAYVPQQIVLLDASIAENIALGVPPEAIDRERIRCAAGLAQLDEFVARLPGRYDEIVGEHGVRLSGGQRQRIGIARALYRDATLLILDEATSALDGLVEQELMNLLESFRGRQTMILIAHRLDTLSRCDRVFELDDGAVVASGTFAELASKSKRFRRLAGFEA